MSNQRHKGATRQVTRGDACSSCHDEKDAEKDVGANPVVAGPLEPAPVAGKPGHVDLKVPAAYDASNAYLRFQWKTANPYPACRVSGRKFRVRPLYHAPERPVGHGRHRRRVCRACEGLTVATCATRMAAQTDRATRFREVVDERQEGTSQLGR